MKKLVCKHEQIRKDYKDIKENTYKHEKLQSTITKDCHTTIMELDMHCKI